MMLEPEPLAIGGPFEEASPTMDATELCKFCNRPITEEEKLANDVSMFQSTECFHMFHITCFRTFCDNNMTQVNHKASQFEFIEP